MTLEVTSAISVLADADVARPFFDGCVYFIGTGPRDDPFSAPVKVGFSKDPKKRREQLQAGSAERLRVHGHVAASMDVELFLHAEFERSHLRGEWFLFEKDGPDRDWIVPFQYALHAIALTTQRPCIGHACDPREAS